MNALSLFSGIGGLDLAALAVGFDPVAMCEIEPFPVQILKKRFPDVPILDDVRKVNGHDYEAVDIVYGGFPCQDLSLAGRRRGLVDSEGNITRSGLWFEMLRIVRESSPCFVVGENVRGAVNAALDVCSRGLEAEGYEVGTVLIPASAVGAPHQRERIFIYGVRRDILGLERSPAERLADAGGKRLQRSAFPLVSLLQGPQSYDQQPAGCDRMPYLRTPDANADRGAMSEELYQRRVKNGESININAQVAHIERNWPTVKASANERTGSTQYTPGSMHSAVLGDIVAENEGKRGQLNPAWVEQLMGYPDGWTDPDCDEPGPWMGWPARPGEEQHAFEHPRTVVGLPNRAKRLKALGNAVVPQQAEPVFRALAVIYHMAFEF